MADLLPVSTDRLLLRPLEEADLDAFAAYRNKPEVARYQSWSSFSTADGAAYISDQRTQPFDTDGTWFQLVVIRRRDNVLIGDVAVHFLDEGRQAEIGVTFDSAHQKQGYAFEAVSRVVDLLFTDLGKHRVIAITDAENVAAQKLLENVGFRQEAHWRQNTFFKGAWSDEFGYALLNSEWQARRGRQDSSA
jgi:RimJ/RimL family protein N-acetyltransferase